MSKEQHNKNTAEESAVSAVSVPEKPPLEMENSPGQQLLRARENLGLSQQQVADRLHLRIISVKAVEQDELEPGVSVTFNKGYVRLYARLVNLDANALIEQYEKLHVQYNDPAKLQSFSRKTSRDAHDHRWNMVTIVVILLVIGSVIAWWVQQSDSFEDSQDFVSDTLDGLFTETQTSQNGNAQQSLQNEGYEGSDFIDITRQDTGPEITEEALSDTNFGDPELDISMDDNKQFVDDIPLPSEQLDNRQVDDVDTINNNVQVNDDTTSNAEQSLLIANGYEVNSDGTVDIVFTFSKDCWVSVKDVNGEIMAIGTKEKGRVMQVTGLAPVSIILGTANAVEINFAGKDVDMTAYPDNRTANFQLPVEAN